MFSKIFFLLVAVCVVKASVLTVNVFDEDPKDEVASSPKDCNPQACDQLCRRLKLPGGACVNGRCKCDNFLNVEDEPEAEVLANPRKCRDRACDWLCRALNNTSGACVDGRCKCTKSVVAEDDVGSGLSEDQNERGCNQGACDQLCRRLKFTGGTCVNGRCKCDNFLGTEDAVDEYSELDERCVCRITKCNQTCTRRGYEIAKCINGRCKCYNKTQKLGEISETLLPVSELLEDQNERGCNQRACHQLCRRLKFPGGACFNGRCKCDNFFGTEDAANEYSELDTRRGCRITKCNRTCTRLGYDSATCVNRHCKCYNKTQTQAEISETSLSVSELAEDQNERGCNPKVCDQLCRRLKFTGGACVNGRCKCDKFFGTEAEIFETSLPVSELAEDQNERGCNPKVCDQLCRRLKFTGGACVNGRCKCDKFFGTEDASPLSEVTSDENEESNENLRTYEELTDTSPRACNTPSCNQMCHRLNYAGGLCRYGQCKCY